ncbi:MAG: putative metal-binding motif-containing protein [Myxococcota bacterium]
MRDARRTTIGAGFAAVLAALGCAGGPLVGVLGPPRITAFEVITTPCGDWTAAVSVAEVRGEDVVLRRDGVELERWDDVWGTRSWAVDGERLGDSATFEVAIGEQVHETRPAAFEPPRLIAEIRPSTVIAAPGGPLRFDLWVDALCPVPDLEWRARTEEWTGSGPITGAVTAIEAPPHADGQHLLQLDVVDAHRPLGDAEATVIVGPADALDGDRDGYPASADCDDRDPGVHPDGLERPEPNGVDDDCDGTVDEGTVAYDDDGDGLSERAGDCDDRDAQIAPGAPERPDCRDNDCDGQVDDGVTLPIRDDGYEQPDGAAYSFEATRRRFDATLDLVSRDRQDREAVRFWSDDGDWDSWGIDVIADRLPADSAYDVEIRRVDGPVLSNGQLHADGEAVSLRGRSGSDDSSEYEVVVRPARLYAKWCPVVISITSR